MEPTQPAVQTVTAGMNFERQVKEARRKRLVLTIVDLVDLKVKGIISEAEYKVRRCRLLGF